MGQLNLFIEMRYLRFCLANLRSAGIVFNSLGRLYEPGGFNE